MAARPVTEAAHYGYDASHLPKLNCAGCTLCCLNDEIILHLTEDDHTLYETDLRPDGKRTLKRTEPGNCVYLRDNGCVIQDHKPIYDCRVDYQRTLKMPHGMARNLRLWQKPTQRGRSLLASIS